MEPNFDFFSSIGMIKSLKKFKLLLHPEPGAADDPEKKESLRNDEFTLVYRLPYLNIILNHKKFVYV